MTLFFFCSLMLPIKDTLMPAASSKTDLGEILSDRTEKRLDISLGDGRTLKQIMEEDFFFLWEKNVIQLTLRWMFETAIGDGT